MKVWIKCLFAAILGMVFAGQTVYAEDAKPAAYMIKARLAGKTAAAPKAVPEAWIEAEVLAKTEKAHRPKPKAVEAVSDWIELPVGQATKLQAEFLTVTAQPKAGEPLVIQVTMTSGNAVAMGSLKLDPKPGTRQVMEATHTIYLAIELVAPEKK